MSENSYNPLIDPAPKEIPLPKAPLVSVICQVRFPIIASIDKRDFIGPFQEAIRGSYPVLRAEQTQGVFFSGPLSGAQMPIERIWRFKDESDNWQVSLSSEFLSLDTKAYTTRKDFLDRLQTVLNALAQHIKPTTIDRIGLRYTDRLKGEVINNIKNLIKPEALGILGALFKKQIHHSLNETLLEIPGKTSKLQARWGYLPKGGSIDPSALAPIEEPSWILDLDMFSSESTSLIENKVFQEIETFADRIYAFFRWVVTDDFIVLYGGKL